MPNKPTESTEPANSANLAVPAMRSGPRVRDNPLTRSTAGLIGIAVLGSILLACFASVGYTFGTAEADPVAGTAESVRYDFQDRNARQIPPTWAWSSLDEASLLKADTYQQRIQAWAVREAVVKDARRINNDTSQSITADQLIEGGREPTQEQIERSRPFFALGTDILGRSLLIRCLAGGAISLGIGISAAMISVFLGTLYGSIAGYVGGRTDALMMRVVDVLYGLPYILLVVLLAVAAESLVDEYIGRSGARASWKVQQVREFPPSELAAQTDSVSVTDARRWLREHTDLDQTLTAQAAKVYPERPVSESRRRQLDLLTLLVAIGGVSWLTMARVVRGQVLSLKNQPFMEAARAMGVPVTGQFLRHLLPNLVGPIVVYATLTVPQAVLQESFLSFLGIGVRPPVPSWGNLAADALVELNPFESNWWLLLFPCLLLAITLLALNFVGEGLREALDPKRSR